MNLATKKDIENNVFIVTVYCKELGTADLTDEQERELLNDFPSKIIYKDLSFKGKFNVANGVPIFTEDDTGEEISLTLTNQEITLDENFSAVYRVDMNKVQTNDLGEILNSKELVCWAKCNLFAKVIEEEAARILADIRSKANTFSGETEKIV